MASLFGITADDVRDKIMPNASAEDWAFQIGESGDLSEAMVLEIVEAQEAMVESYLPHKYQVLLRRVEGEVAVRFAAGGETTVQSGLTPMTELHGVYRNFPRTRAWGDRRPGERLVEGTEYSVVLVTGTVTLAVPLLEEERVYLDYSHGAAAGFVDLRHLVLNLTAVEVSRRLSYFRSAEGFDRFEQWQSSASGHLRDLDQGRVKVPRLDRLELVNETGNLNLGAL
jgi:hypothetical protein